MLTSIPISASLPDAAESPVVIWTVILTTCAVAILLAIAKVVGPLGEAFESNAERHRQYKQRDEDARIVDLSSQVDHLAGRVYTLELQQHRQDQYLVEHAKWDHELLMAAIAAGLEVSEPPPLRPPIDAP